jgi:pilus assembly protein Flp/PilA
VLIAVSLDKTAAAAGRLQLEPSITRAAAITPATTAWELSKRVTIMKAFLLSFARDESGVTVIEYGLIAGLIAVVIIGAVTLVGTDLQGMFNTVATALAPAA